MTSAKFKRFFDEAIVPSQANMPRAFECPDLPESISDEARLFLENDKGPSAPIDIHDKAIREMARKLVGGLWYSVEEHLAIEHTARTEPIAGVPCKIFTPPNVQHPKMKLLFFHGGGYWLGSARENSSIALQLMRATELEVISVDYRLAPECPFPAAQDDAVVVYKALLSSGVLPENIVLTGESAGGGLAVSLMTEIAKQNLPKPAALALVAPWLDLTFSGESHKTNNMTHDTRLSVEGLTAAAKAYAGKAGVEHPGVSPLFADPAGFPPTLMQVGSSEILLSDSERFIEKAKAAGVDAEIDVYEAMWHVWQFYPHLPEAERAIKQLATFILTHIGTPS